MDRTITFLDPNFLNELKSYIEAIVSHFLQEYMVNLRMEDKWLTIEEACKHIKVTKPTLWTYTNKGFIHKYYIGDSPRYKKSEIDKAFIKLHS